MLGSENTRRCRSAALAQAKVELQKSVQKAKGKMGNDSLKNQREAEVWRVGKFANPQDRMAIEASPNSDGKQPHTITIQDRMLG
jgi:hypothetical protein